MVARGIRKRFNDDVEAQRASVEAAEWQRHADLDKSRLRYSVCWYDVKTGIWAEVEAIPIEWIHDRNCKVKWAFHSIQPKRYVSTWGLVLRKGTEKEEFFGFESGFVADGLNHAVWIGDGSFNRKEGRREFDKDKSKTKLHAQPVNNIGVLPELFWQLYQVRISLPQIQEGYKRYQMDAVG